MAEATGETFSRLNIKNTLGYRFYTFRAETSQNETVTVPGLSTIVGCLGGVKDTASGNAFTFATNVITYTGAITDKDFNGIVWGIPA